MSNSACHLEPQLACHPACPPEFWLCQDTEGSSNSSRYQFRPCGEI